MDRSIQSGHKHYQNLYMSC